MNRRQYLSTVSTAAVGIVGVSGTAAAADGPVEVVSEPPYDQYDNGDEVPITVKVENEGPEIQTLYVGYSVYGPDGEFYDNDKGTDEDTDSLSPGQTDTVDLSWKVEADAPEGSYGYVVKLYEGRTDDGEPDEQLVNHLYTVDAKDEDAFEVERP